ncbi:MAG: glycosyltransferase [Rhizobacter sp.]|nr:glycosyltransferase [Rhizobacter sp.]
MTPRISVVITTRSRPQLLLRCLTAVLTQQFEPEAYEVIVVDDGHDDATRDLVHAVADGAPLAAELRYLRPLRGQGPAVARNVGWRAARSEIIAFTDDDSVPAPTWLAEGENALHTHRDWVALCGRVSVPVRGEATDHARTTASLTTAEFVTVNAFVRHWALVRVNGFDERFASTGQEDADLQFRLMAQAGTVGRSSRAEVVHPVRAAPWGLSLVRQRDTYFDALLYKKHPQLYRQRLRRIPPWSYYAIVALAIASLLLPLLGEPIAARWCAAAMVALMLRLAARRLYDTSQSPSHVLEMLATSALIPFLSVYWRLRGAIHFRVLFL